METDASIFGQGGFKTTEAQRTRGTKGRRKKVGGGGGKRAAPRVGTDTGSGEVVVEGKKGLGYATTTKNQVGEK